MADKMKVGVIGVGGIAHPHARLEDNAYAEAVAGCDVSEPALLKWSEKFGIDKISTNADDLINDPTIDIIDICTPNNYHAPLAIAAMKAGKHVLCEKPLAPNPQQILDMIAARDASGKLLMTAQHFRFTPAAKAMKAEIDTGVLGGLPRP